MNRYVPIAILIACFLLLKLSSLGIRISDTNPYFYTAYELLNGKMLYKDVFFTNFPLFPYISTLYLFISGKQLLFYYFTSALEAAVTGFFIYLIILRQTKKMLLATVSAALYLFSFILLATTDHQTGVFLASLFAIISYYFYTEKKFLLTGIFIALALLTKAYFLPIFLTYMVMLFFGRYKREGESEKKPVIARNEVTKQSYIYKRLPRSFSVARNDILFFTLGFFATVGIILLPSLLFAQTDFFKDVFQYSLTRAQGLSKVNILRFFVFHDLLIVLSLFYSLLMIRKYLFFGILAIFSLAFILLYQDIYYLYLNFLLPFFCIAFLHLYQDIEKRFKPQEMILPTIIGIVLLINLFIYLTGYSTLAKVENIDALVKTIKQANPPSLYGENGIMTALAYLSNTPLLNKSVDMNPNIFKKGYLNATDLTKQALEENSLMVATGLNYPEYSVRQDIVDEIFDLNQMKDCRVIYSHPVRTEGYQNRINLISCN